MRAIASLKARGDTYCWRGCGTWLLADAPRGHPQHITLGHIQAWEDRPDLFWDETNHAAECGPCNYGDGARRTNAKRHRDTTTPKRWINPEWL
jgi:hypothetical protein